MSAKGTITTADYLPFEDYQRLVKELEEEKKYRWCVYCVISFCTGLRVSDVLKLKWGDLIGKRNIIVTEKKTKKTRRIPIGNNAAQHIETLYKKLKKPTLSSYIMTQSTKFGDNAVSKQYINKTLKSWVTKYNLGIKNFSTHTFRKTFGRYVYEKMGRSENAIVYLNRIFRHQSLSTTMIYLGITDDEIGGIFNSIEI